MKLQPLGGTLAIGLALGSIVIALLPIAQAGQRERNYVTAFSRYGNPSLTAAVRPARYGFQVQLPGGVWIDCAASCAETLRREKVDFWETQTEERGGDNWRD